MNDNIEHKQLSSNFEMQELKEVTFEETKARLLDILIEFDTFCQKHNLVYYLAFGTLLGAVRHKGFIPWDDDIDVCMPREDYNRLIELSYKWEIPYDFLCYEKDNTYLFYYGKFSDQKTILKNKYMYETNNLGLFLDVFPMDSILCEKKKIQKIYRRVITDIQMLKFCGMRYFWPAKSLIKSCIKYIFYRYAKIKGSVYWQDKIKNKKYLNIFCKSNKVDCYCIHAYRILPKNIFGHGKKLEFEEHFFNCPQNPEKYLVEEFGKYMELPSEEERKSNHDYSVYWR